MSSDRALKAQIRAFLNPPTPKPVPFPTHCSICRERGHILSRGYCARCSPLDAIYGDLTPGSY